MSTKERLDLLVVARGISASRQRAQALIMAGKILVDHVPIDKPGTKVDVNAQLTLKGAPLPYVSRGGLKLQGALDALNYSPEGRICMDVGASTGGFTDCLLQHGAVKVYAVDVGYGQLAWSLRKDSRVIAIERTNIRHLESKCVPDPVELVTIDVSFISLEIVIPAVLPFLAQHADILALIKPQFEVGKGKLGKGGVVKDPNLHKQVIERLSHVFKASGLRCGPVVPSPVLGPKGNQEFVILLEHRALHRADSI